MDQSQIGLSREYLVKGLEDKIVKGYYSYMVDMAVLFGAKKSDAETQMLDSLNFEIALANVSFCFDFKQLNTLSKLCFFPRYLFQVRSAETIQLCIIPIQ